MAADNKYNSLRETFTSDPILNIQLSAKATPPADFQLTAVDFDTVYLYPSGGGGGLSPRVKFAINDKPRILAVGLFSNLADALVYQDNPDEYDKGPSFQLALQEFNAGGANQGQIDNAQIFRVPELNQLFETDYLFDVSNVTTTLDSLRIQANFALTSMDFTTLSMDPAFANKRLIIRPVVLIEHTFQCSAV